MNKYRKFNTIFLYFTMLIFIASCARENDALVNPPTIFETVRVRFLNFAGDEQPRTLVLEKISKYENIAYNTISSPVPPPFDSVQIEVFKDGNIEFTTGDLKQKFARKTRYIIMTLPSPIGASNYKAVDTIVRIQTTSVPPRDTNDCYIKMFNANNDTTVNYTLRLGCPNDSVIFRNLSYKKSSGIANIHKGTRVFSITKTTKNDIDTTQNTKLLGVYELELLPQGQYAIIINRNEEVFFVDELSDDNNILTTPKLVTEREAYIRIINLSSENVTINNEESEIVSNLNPNFIDKYHKINSCDNLLKDKLKLLCNEEVRDSALISFEIFKKFTAIVLNSKENKAENLMIVPPIKQLPYNVGNKALVRVINCNFKESGINISAGARYDNSNSHNYVSGDVLANALSAGELSKVVAINPGIIPLSVFTSTEPARYLFSTNVVFEANKNYIIAVDFSEGNNNGKLTVIEEAEETIPVMFTKQAAFMQIVNATSDNKQINIELPKILNAAKLDPANSLATFVEEGNNTVTINGFNYNFTAKKADRILIVATGSSTQTDVFAIQSPYLGADSTNYKRRYVNAATDVPTLRVKSDSTDAIEAILQENIHYKTASEIETITREKKIALFFENQQTGKMVAKVPDLMMTLRKNYSVIFYGTEQNGYNVLILQEY